MDKYLVKRVIFSMDAFSYFYLQQFYLKCVYYLFILFIFTCTQFMSILRKCRFNFALMFIIINFIKKKGVYLFIYFIYLFSHVHLHVNLEKMSQLCFDVCGKMSISPAYILHFASI